MIRRACAVGSERGAVLVHVAVSLLVLTAFSALAIDYGILWVARGQVQNAADAGALAGAVSLAFDSFTERGETGPAKQAAHALATSNLVWLESGSVSLATDITFPNACDDIVTGNPTVIGGQTPCIRVDVHRTAERGTALPTYFAQLLGVDDQSVRATATAQVVSANATDCLKPLAIADKWVEISNPMFPWHSPTGLGRFNRYTPAGALLPVALRDLYTPPSSTGAGTGFQTGVSIGGLGYPLSLTEAPQPFEAIGRGQFIAVDLPRTAAAVNAFQANVEGCNGISQGLGQALTPLSGSNLSFAVAAATALMGLDPAASWNPTTATIQNSCAAGASPCAPFSPRLIALPVFDVGRYEDTRQPGMTLELRVVNILGFFIESVSTGSIDGRIAHHPGLVNSSAPTLTHQSAFLRTAVLVR